MYLLKTSHWYLERIIFLLAGVMTLVSVILMVLHSIWWLILTTLVGLNLIIYATTGFCVMAVILAKFIRPELQR